MSNLCDSSLSLTQGDDVVISVDVFDSCDDDASPVDLTGAVEIKYTMSEANGCDEVLTKDLSNGIAAPVSNALEITLDSADTVELCGVYSHSCYVVDSNNKRTTIFQSNSVCIAK